MTKKINKHKVAVYGSLRKGLGNHNYYLKNSTLIGTFQSNPDYTLYSLGAFPGIKNGGHTSVTMELYEVDDRTLNNLDVLEGVGYDFYLKEKINTPFGEAIIYIYNEPIDGKKIVEHGDWKEYLVQQSRLKLA